MSSHQWDQLIINDRVMVVAVQESLVVNVGEMVDGGMFMFDPAETIYVVPGVPLRTLLPLEAHEKEILAMLVKLI